MKIKNKIREFIKSITLTRLISYIAVLLLSAVFFYCGSKIEYVTNNGYQELHNSVMDNEYVVVEVIDTVDAWVIHKKDYEDNDTPAITEKGYIYYCKVVEGDNKGDKVYVVHKMDNVDCAIIKEISKGSKIYTTKITDKNFFFFNYPDCEFKEEVNLSFSAASHAIDHSTTLITLGIIFVILLLVFSRIKGFHTLLALALACASIILVYVPAVLSGKNIYLWTIIICLYSIIETLVLLEGITKKAITAAIGCVSGILVSAIICAIANNTMNIMGASDELGSEEYWIYSTYWEVFERARTIDLRGIVFSSVLFGAMGAIMDVSMSLASSLLEVYNNSTNHSLARTMKSGFNIGRDMLGTMSNTLVLAYMSTSLALILYYISHYYPEAIYRQEFFAIGISQALIGCIGILITIPLTSFVCGLIYNKKSEWFPAKKEKLI